MSRSLLTTTLVTAISIMTFQPCSAAIIDTLDTADGFNDSFNGTTAVANGDGTVTLTRTVANVDAGINWTDMGSKIQLSGQNVLQLTPSAAVNGGYYGVNILFFDAADQYLSEQVWITDTNDTAMQQLSDIQALAGDPNAASFVLRFRIQPWGQAGAAFTFDQIEVVPEPASLALLTIGGLLVMRRAGGRAV